LYPVYLEIKSEESICSINFINLWTIETTAYLCFSWGKIV
jgi:hypothetical protein